MHAPSLRSGRALCLPARRVAVGAARPRHAASRAPADAGPLVVAAPLPSSPLLLEPALRSFVLGVGAGAAFETAHVVFKLAAASFDAGLPAVWASLSPLFVADHVVAIGSWALFFLLEAAAIAGVVRQFPNDPETAAREARAAPTLGKKMLPLSLTPVAVATVPPPGPAPTAPPTATAFVSAPPSVAPPPTPRALPVPPPPTATGAPPSTSPRLADLAARRARDGLAPGALDPHSILARRAAELEGRKAYLRNFWYCVGVGESIPHGKPVGVEALGEKLVLFRDGADGRVHALADACVHRGAPLSSGWLSTVDGQTAVTCPYHGWCFSKEGAILDVPAAEKAGEWPRKPVTDAYPVEEKGGFVWLFFGSPALPADERPPIPYVPELDDKGWKAVYGEIEFDCDAWGVFENAIDMAHIHYLHSDTFGNQEQPEIRNMQVKSDAYGVQAAFSLHNKPVNSLWKFSQVPEVHVTARALLPSTSVISFTLGAGLSFTTFVNTTPVAPGRAINRFALIRRLSSDPTGLFNAGVWDGVARRAMLRILGEDKAMVERLAPAALDVEVSVKADLPQTAFRKLRQEYLDMGYGVAPPKGKGGCGGKGAAARDF